VRTGNGTDEENGMTVHGAGHTQDGRIMMNIRKSEKNIDKLKK